MPEEKWGFLKNTLIRFEICSSVLEGVVLQDFNGLKDNKIKLEISIDVRDLKKMQTLGSKDEKNKATLR